MDLDPRNGLDPKSGLAPKSDLSSKSDLAPKSFPPEDASATSPGRAILQPPHGSRAGFPGTLEVPSSSSSSSSGLGAVHRKLSAPSPPGSGESCRPVALERWQTETYPDKRERSQSIPSRAWIPLAGAISTSHADDDESDASSEADLHHAPPDGGQDLGTTTTGGKSIRGIDAPKEKKKKRKSLMHRILVNDRHCRSTGSAQSDGRLAITVHETAHTGYIANALGAVAHSMRPRRAKTTTARPTSLPSAPPPLPPPPPPLPMPRLSIVVMVVGSRGDVQPFLRIGKYLKEELGHRIRIATHPTFRDLVEKDSGLEFFSVGGDPAELMAFMVKNPGMIPTLQTMKAGEIGRRRAAMAEMFDGFWRSCIHASEHETTPRGRGAGDRRRVFVADAIIANPPSFAHIHCAEALGIPLHLVFTFPYTPTHAFPHPLASIKQTNVDQGYTNFISYPLVEMMTWQGLGDLINDMRVNTLALDPVSTLWAPCATYRMHVPVTYLWSPGLIPKPQDWGDEIAVSGFVFLDLASAFHPPPELVRFLDAGEPPVYIGFGSIVVDDADRFTDLIFEAVEKAGVRALVSRGWGGLGRDDVPESIFMLDNTPHDWLFPRVRGCVHHGGAGTTAIGLKCGLPTMIVPFFGDQYFWGSMVGKSGAGPEPVPYKRLTADRLADGIRYLLTAEARAAAGRIARSIEQDGDGAKNTLDSFRKQMRAYGPPTLSCAIVPSHVAVWKVKGTHVRLGAVAAHMLVEAGHLSWKRLRLLRHTEWLDFEGPGEPVTAAAESLKNTVRDVLGGIGSGPIRVGKTAKRRLCHRMHSRPKRNGGGGDGPQTDEQIPAIRVNGEKPDKPEPPPPPPPSLVPGPGQYARDISSSVRLTALAVARAPANLLVALAQGFHNAPRLYGDDTVRRPTRVSGFRSGLVASRRELVYGVYDGVTGVVRLPVRGARNEGVVGLLKGAGMGLGGLVLKPVSAVLGPLGYSVQGVVKQVERRRSPRRFVRRARMAQGEGEVGRLGAARARELAGRVCAGWQVLQRLGRAIADDERRRGLAGQVDRVTLDVAFLFASVERARTCLDDLTAGKSLDDVMTGYKEWNVKETDPSYYRSGTSRSHHDA
ncbi:uncharacterized protein UV8b_07186 [Ustilaginoidea virens]|uniref:UDP-glucose,sterol transferase n=1 Tax=Ustilaginoidea virens TaxID=1159556 RepID=A0A8E5HWK5_USTVR|nr:uncharacterized protein UV8b_07186 [Ustilaginoidea virens]QUC22945.1 hypothetical protein UV8b_07186 [Ustilaginoidea virens]